MTYQRIIKPERDTQNRTIDLLLAKLPYTYIGNLEDTENSNIREDDLRKFLTEHEHCNEQEANEAIRELKTAAACSTYASLYEKGEECYQLLRNGTNVSGGYGTVNRTIRFIDYDNPLKNDFAIAEEVTVRRVSEDIQHRRPDIVIYVNGIALVVLELKKMSVSVADAIRQNRRNQEDGEICQFFTTPQILMAGNESEGIKYAVTKTPEEYWLHWKEPTGAPCKPSVFTPKDYPNEMMRSLLQLLEPSRLLEIIHDCIIYDGGVKKIARPNQYFALVEAKERVQKKEGGIIWHSQGSGKSLTMVWLAQWIIEQGGDARVVIVTDRDELDKQIEKGFKRTGETPYRVKSGGKLIETLNKSEHHLICTLIHKFGIGLHDEDVEQIEVGEKKSQRSPEECMEQIARALPEGFKPKGNIFVFVDECHRTQGGILHKAMKKIMGDDVMMIGFTGTPLLKQSKLTSLEQFGPFIHTYKFDEAVRDKVILDLRYEARNVEQTIEESDKQRIDRIFEARTALMTERAKAALRNKWATLQNIYSSDPRMKRIVSNICEDMLIETPLFQGYGNAMLVAGDVHQAYKYWELFEQTELRGKTTVVTSYDPATGVPIDQGHSSDALDPETYKCMMAKRMMGSRSAEEHEEWAKEQFINHPETMKLLIVVDKLLTGFDAPHATYLYIDRHMEDHNLFQAICRVNRLDDERKEFGYIIDYKDLFYEIRDAVEDYTNTEYTDGAFEAFNKEDVAGLLKNRLAEGKKALEEAFEQLEGICMNVRQPRSLDDYFAYFVYDPVRTPADEQLAASLENMSKREVFYDTVRMLVGRYLAIATQMEDAGYTIEQAKEIYNKVTDFDELRRAIMLRSGDTTDLKQYNAMMRQLLDQYVQAPRSEVLEKLSDFSFLDVIDISKPANELAGQLEKEENIIGGQPAAAETIASSVRRYIIRKRDANPDYYDKLSEKLEKLLEEMRLKTIDYRHTLRKIVEFLQMMKSDKGDYPASMNTAGKKALFDNLGKDEDLALRTHAAILVNAEQGFRLNKQRQKKLRRALSEVEGFPQEKLDEIMSIIIHNEEF